MLATITQMGLTKVMLTSYTHTTFKQPPEAHPTTLSMMVKTLGPSDMWEIEVLQIKDEGINVAKAIRAGKCRVVSNGLYQEGRTASAFTIHGQDPNKHVTTCNVVPLPCQDANSYRGELEGIFRTLTTLALICKLHNIHTGAAMVGLDGLSTFVNIQQEDAPPPHILHYDLVMAIWYKIGQLPIKITLRYVVGHQDKKGLWLDWWGQQNIKMDKLAKLHLQRTAKCPQAYIQVGPHQWVVKLNDSPPH
jgi:hypothetical protein